jgi:hypothetical protein
VVFSDSERDSFPLPVPSISQDLVLQGTGSLTLSTAQSFSTRNPHFYRISTGTKKLGKTFRGSALPELLGPHFLNQGQKYELGAENRLFDIDHWRVMADWNALL